jgi:hypothetical protein
MASSAITPMLKQEYMDVLRIKPFSRAMDEASNTNVEYLAINARFFINDGDKHPTTKLIQLLKIEDSCNGLNSRFNYLKSLLFEGDSGLERLNDLVEITTDGASKLISRHS